jgi:lysophospholipase L1-like esterase
MPKHFLSLLFLIVIGSFTVSVIAQNNKPPFFDQITAFKRNDSIRPPVKDPIVFVGSSSFAMWRNMNDMFKGYPVLNRGFGGSTLVDVQRYLNDIVIPYRPKQVIIYAGENDIASGNVDATLVTERFKTVFHQIRQKLPGVPIVFIAMKPSPSREKFLPIIMQGNRMINNFLYQQKNAGFVDIYPKMLDASGKPNQELFLEDNLHMNEKGYEIWRAAILPYLLK